MGHVSKSPSGPRSCSSIRPGKVVWRKSEEFKAADVAKVISADLGYYRAQRILDERPIQLAPERSKEQETPLRFPGKILADESGNRLFISDSNHNRIVVATLDGKLLDVIGSGLIGRKDGDYKTATFNHPQGCALVGEALYVADTENHLLRKVDLAKKRSSRSLGRVSREYPRMRFQGGTGGLSKHLAAAGSDVLRRPNSIAPGLWRFTSATC